MATQVSSCQLLEFQIHWQGLYWDTYQTGHGLIDCICTIFLLQFVASVSRIISVEKHEIHSQHYLHNFFCFFTAMGLSNFCYDYTSQAVYCVIFGITSGAYVGLTSVVLVDLLGLDKLTNAFGLLLLFQGIASVIGSPFIGKCSRIG